MKYHHPRKQFLPKSGPLLSSAAISAADCASYGRSCCGFVKSGDLPLACPSRSRYAW